MKIGEQLEPFAIFLEGAVLSEGDLERFYNRAVQCHGSSNVSEKTSLLNSCYRYYIFCLDFLHLEKLLRVQIKKPMEGLKGGGKLEGSI